MSFEDMYAASKAIVRTVRTHIPISSNLDTIWNGLDNSRQLRKQFISDIKHKIRKNVSPYSNNPKYYKLAHIREKVAKRACRLGLGLCKELVNTGRMLATMKCIPEIVDWYVKIYENRDHALLFFSKEKDSKYLPFTDLDGIWGMPPYKIPSGIICDPWIYATAISNKDGCETIMKLAKERCAEPFFLENFSCNDKLNVMKCASDWSEKNRSLYPQKEIFQSLQETFLTFYKEEKRNKKQPDFKSPYIGSFSRARELLSSRINMMMTMEERIIYLNKTERLNPKQKISYNNGSLFKYKWMDN